MIGERIKSLRENLGQSQEELAHSVGMHPNTIARWERGELTPRGTSLSKVARALNTTSTYLLGETDEPASVAGNFSINEPASNGEATPYTQEQINKGMLVYTLSNGERIELPPIQASYDFLKEIALRTAQVAVL